MPYLENLFSLQGKVALVTGATRGLGATRELGAPWRKRLYRSDYRVSVDASDEPGTLTTKPLVFLGDTLVVNANAVVGSLAVEALDTEGNVIEGFGAADCTPITSGSVRHVLKWKDNPDCHLLQARPIKLWFHLKNANICLFEPKILHNHYLPSYD